MIRRADERRGGIHDDQQFHHVVVGGVARRLDDEHVLATDVFLDFDEDLLVGEAPHHAFGEGNFEIGRDRLGKGAIGVPGDEFHASVRGGSREREANPAKRQLDDAAAL